MSSNEGYLILGDITGYTSYVASTELEHSQEILTELLELILTHFKQLLTIVKIEGDAIFAYIPVTELSLGEYLFDLIESTYVAFRKRIQTIAYNTSCQCKACRAIPTLDLKFFTHYGTYAEQNILGIKELVGSDVNLIHRLTKNHVTEKTGWIAYALFTEQCILKLGISPHFTSMEKLTETYEHLGNVEIRILDLHSHYNAFLKRKPVFITSEQAGLKLEFEFDAPQAIIWDWLTSPEKRNKVSPDNVWSAINRPNGRKGIGAKNHCAHGITITSETILDWQPFDYYTAESIQNITTESPSDAIQTTQLIPISNGQRTKIIQTFKLLREVPEDILEKMAQGASAGMMQFYTAMNDMVIAELAGREE